MSDAQPPAPARPSRVAALGGRVYEHQLPRSLAGGKEKDVAAAAVWRPNSLIYYPSSLCVSPRCGGRADGGLSLFAKSTCNFRMFSRRPPSSSFFPFFVCSPFLQKRFNGRSTAPARSLLSPPCFLFCAASLCKRYSRKIAGSPYKVCQRLLASGARIFGALMSYKPLAQVMRTLYAP